MARLKYSKPPRPNRKTPVPEDTTCPLCKGDLIRPADGASILSENHLGRIVLQCTKNMAHRWSVPLTTTN